MSGVCVEAVSKRFGNVQALDNVSLDVQPGELVALLGPSGCGKTTLLRSVAGLETPSEGRIVIDGRDVTGDPPRRRPIGMVFQSYALFPNMTVRQNVDFPLKVRKIPLQERKRRVDELLDLVHLTEQADRYPHQISGGQQQRTALARALAPSPEVLLLDEPLSALDALVRARLRDEIRRIQQMLKITALYVTHDQAEAMAIADRVAVMNRGRIEQIAAPSELYEEPATRFTASFVGNRNALVLPVSQGCIQLGQALSVPARVGDGSEAIVFFRPEDVRISHNGKGHPALVETKMFQGVLTRLQLLIEHERQQARIHADVPSRDAASLEPGAQVRIVIPKEAVRVFALEE